MYISRDSFKYNTNYLSSIKMGFSEVRGGNIETHFKGLFSVINITGVCMHKTN